MYPLQKGFLGEFLKEVNENVVHDPRSKQVTDEHGLMGHQAMDAEQRPVLVEVQVGVNHVEPMGRTGLDVEQGEQIDEITSAMVMNKDIAF